ncbi:MAG TPA: tetratricopeptide repeat protein, partial [Cyclobacteriaceae bacterium]|nr:tetratricopeptide repeat protein [Cyclobacteriaceae bacterium]
MSYFYKVRVLFSAIAYSILLVLAFPSFCRGQDWENLNKQGLQYYNNGQYEEASRLFLRSMKVANETNRPDSIQFLTALTNLAFSEKALGNYDSAQKYFRMSAEIAKEIYQPFHIESVTPIINLANSFLPSGEYDSCEHYAMASQQLLHEISRTNSEHYRENIFQFYDASINVQNLLASLAYRKGQYKIAIDMMDQQRQSLRQVYPETYRTSELYHTTLNNLATYYLANGNVAQAKPIVREQANIALENGDSVAYLYALNNLGSVYRNLNESDSAIFIYAAAAKKMNSGSMSDTDLHIAVLTNLGELYFTREQYADAVTALQHSIEVQ